MTDLAVTNVEPSSLYDIRRRILRAGDLTASFDYEQDHASSARHFAGVLDDRIVVSASFFLVPAPIRPELVSYQLRFMAVEADVQGKGYGTVVLDTAEAVLRDLGAQQLWANARDTALGFYLSTGWSLVEGSENVSAETNLPHTKVAKLIPAV
jgi:GNAT superfamily N-acetyltransferase